MKFNLLLVGQRLNPGGAVGSCPDRVVDTCEVGGKLATPFPQKVRQQDAQLIICQWILRREQQFVPHFGGSRLDKWRGYEFVPGIKSRATGCPYATGEDGEEPQGA